MKIFAYLVLFFFLSFDCLGRNSVNIYVGVLHPLKIGLLW